MKVSKALTWDDLANEYKKETGNTAHIQPMEAIFDWAERQDDKFFVDPDKKTIHKIKKNRVTLEDYKKADHEKPN